MKVMACVQRAFAVSVGALSLAGLLACAESASSGTDAFIPDVVIDCQTAKCRTAANPTMIVLFSTSGCDEAYAGYGGAVSGSTRSIACDATVGCYGELTSWVKPNGNDTPTTVMPSGTYSICGRIDFNHDYPHSQNDDAVIERPSVPVMSETEMILLEDWTDI